VPAVFVLLSSLAAAQDDADGQPAWMKEISISRPRLPSLPAPALENLGYSTQFLVSCRIGAWAFDVGTATCIDSSCLCPFIHAPSDSILLNGPMVRIGVAEGDLLVFVECSCCWAVDDDNRRRPDRDNVTVLIGFFMSP
jgi:hypothetical protein